MIINAKPRKVSKPRRRFGRTLVIRIELFDERVDPTNGNSFGGAARPRISSVNGSVVRIDVRRRSMDESVLVGIVVDSSASLLINRS